MSDDGDNNDAKKEKEKTSEILNDLKSEGIDKCPCCKSLVYLRGHKCEGMTLNEKVMLETMIYENELKNENNE